MPKMNISFKISFLLILRDLAFTKTLTLPPVAIGNHSTFPTLPVYVPIPPAPPGYGLDTIWDESKPISPIGVYTAVISLMWELSNQSWTAQIDPKRPGPVVRALDNRVFAVTTIDGPTLQVGHVVLAYHQTVLDMYKRRPGFFTAITRIMLDGQRIGRAGLLPEPPLLGNPNSTMPDLVNTVNPPLVSSTKSVAENSGVVIDPEDPRFSVSWRFDGSSIPAQELYSSVIDGIATVAQYETNARCASVTGVSFSGNVAFHVDDYLGAALHCGQISKAFLFISVVVFENRKFEGVEITLEYDNITIGTGDVFKVRSVESHNSNSTARIATS
ncbi:hypothetical protein HO133_005317 [Letharia lupina]|uniref:Uncharacterized protein n=1 Tax=Letharia lupina TaxID=560253 RepID=A0A8H6C8G1_9LECA|nr:uncharacterized protein HO133_005317 [Letharia lupina]KAF6218774.1 hypothetical protein HO133_005317 [Letharia lupina]